MFSSKSHRLLRIVSASVLVLLSVALVPAQDDPDPNSPTPILLSEADSTRALATAVGKSVRSRSSSQLATSQVFWPDQTVQLYVTNLSLMDDEGANAFRLYMKDAMGREYRLPVLEIKGVDWDTTVYAVTTKLTDEIRYWPGPTADGDVLLRLSWRGLTSNSVRLGLGAVGGAIKDEPGAVPTPLSSVVTKSSGKDGPPTNELSGYRWSGDRMRFLEQATFGPTELDDYRVRRIGLRAWLTDQFTLPYPTNPYPVIPLKSTTVETAPPLGCGPRPEPVTAEYNLCIRDYYQMYHVQNWFFKEAFYGAPQLRHRVAWALSQIWVISGVDTQQPSWMIEYHQQLSKNAFGNYRQLMYDITLNPGMGNYLDMMRSTRNNPNENYPREILQLFSIGLFMLNQDGTLQLDGEGNPIATYDQNTVNNFTKVFTGWRDCRTADFQASCPDALLGTNDFKDPMSLNPGQHDITAKTLLTYPGVTNQNVAACAGCTTNAQIYPYAYTSLNQALDNIYRHPNVAPFVSKLLIQHLVTSDPTPAYVGRVSAVFTAQRDSPTQLQQVVKAILLDPEARGDVKTEPRYGKLREPVQLLTNVLRNFNVASANLAGQSDGVVNNSVAGLGQNVFTAPTVFNYYQPNYIVPGSTILGPEFGIYTTGTAIGRANLFSVYAFNGIGVALPNTPNGTRISLTEAQSISAADTTGNLLLDYLNTKMLHGTMSTQMRNAIRPAIVAASATNHLTRAQHAVYLIATSSQYQVQR